MKWAGGKRQLIPELTKRLPTEFGDEGMRRYAEPFVGGGALLFELFDRGMVDEALICDFNQDLVLAYTSIRDIVSDVMEQLQSMQERYDSTELQMRKEMYFSLRQEFNSTRSDFDYETESNAWPVRTAQMIFLNKTGFNGLYRVNKKGEFNVPPSDMRDKRIFDRENIESVSEVLQRVEIRMGDFEECQDWVDSRTLVYFDPPYRPIVDTSFTTYSTSDFNDADQGRLADFCWVLASAGASVMASNSDPRNTNAEDDFFDRAYPSERGFKIHNIRAIRAINSDGAGRGDVGELIITSY